MSRFSNRVVGRVLVSLMLLVASLAGSAHAVDVPVYGVFEVTLTTAQSHSNPYTDVEISATFQGPSSSMTVSGFWDGSQAYKIRFAPTEVGTWTLVSVQSTDSDLDGKFEGTQFNATVPTPVEISQNEVLRHGFVRVSSSNPHHFEHADGMPFFVIGDAIWRGWNFDRYASGRFQQLMDDRVARGMTVQANADIGAHGNFAPNEGGWPFSSDQTASGSSVDGMTNLLNPEYFQAMDLRVAYMTRKGIIPLILMGDPDGGLTKDSVWLDRFQRYLAARYAAYNVFWTGAKEFEEWKTGYVEAARAIGNALEQWDPYGHPTSIHSANKTTNDGINSDTWLDYHSWQVGVATGWSVAPVKPSVNVEFALNYGGACSSGQVWCVATPAQMTGLMWKNMTAGTYVAGYGAVECATNSQLDWTGECVDNAFYDGIEYMARFYTENTNYWQLAPDNTKCSGTNVSCHLNPGFEYVVYADDGGTVMVTVDGASAGTSLAVRWFNPATGTFDGASQTTTTCCGSRSFQSPYGSSPSVLHLRAASGACGNGIKEPGEACDGSEFGGATCQSLGHDAGTLTCTAACTLDVSGCVNDPPSAPTALRRTDIKP